MIEYTIQYNFDAFFVKIVTDCGKVFIRTESGIDLCIIPGIVTVCVRLKDRGKIDGVGAKFFDVRNPVIDL